MNPNDQSEPVADSQPADRQLPAAPVSLTPSVHKGLPWVAAVAMFMQTLDATILNTALPSMAVSMGRSPLAIALGHLALLAERSDAVPIGQTPADLAAGCGHDLGAVAPHPTRPATARVRLPAQRSVRRARGSCG